MRTQFGSWVVAVGLALVASFSSAAWAGPSDQVLSLVAQGKPNAEIIELVHQNKGSWLPRDVYLLIDKGAPPEIIKVVAAHAVVFYDGTNPKSLDAIAAEARGGMAPRTVTMSDPVEMFEWFTEIKTQSDALRATLPPLEPQRAGETPAQFDTRKRLWDEDLVRALAPIEGQIDVTSFAIELPATFAPDAKGCAVGTAQLNFDSVNYFTFRTAMGSTTSKVAIKAKGSRSVVGGEMYNGELKYIKLTSKPVCGEPGNGLLSAGGKAKVQLNRTSQGAIWTATGEFTNKAGEPVPAVR